MASGTDDRPDTVLLDVDGTLIDSNYWHVVAWQLAFSETGAWQPGWRIHTAIGMGGDRLVAAVAGDSVEERLGDDVRAAWKRHYDQLISNVGAFPGATDLVNEFKARDFTVVLASSGNPDHLKIARDLLDADDAIDGVTSGEDAESSKPSGALFQVALRKARGQRAIVIGDTPWDAQAAADLPAPLIALRCGGFPDQALTEAGAGTIFDDPADLLDKLDRTVLRQPGR